ncbi:MAG: sterol carrier protein domain-containing protein [Pseudonocardiaceae bacterium]
MLRVLDLGQAVRLRGWPDDLDITIPLDVTTDTGDTTERFTLRITAGKGELAPSACEGRLRLTRRQFAVWYAGATAPRPRPRWPACAVIRRRWPGSSSPRPTTNRGCRSIFDPPRRVGRRVLPSTAAQPMGRRSPRRYRSYRFQGLRRSIGELSLRKRLSKWGVRDGCSGSFSVFSGSVPARLQSS